jgi:hypothetical protein
MVEYELDMLKEDFYGQTELDILKEELMVELSWAS